MAYKLNENYFDEIDTSNKAYWLGFIWGDGYVCKRDKDGYTTYVLKVALSSVDKKHLEILRDELDSTADIKEYRPYCGFKTDNNEVRFSVYNKSFAGNLYNNYGIVPHRNSMEKIINKIPEVFYTDFFRGLLDANGSICSKDILKWKVPRKEFSIFFMGSNDLLCLYNNFLINNKITETQYKHAVRHEGKDGGMACIRITGNKKSVAVLSLLGYFDNSKISLYRKKEKALMVLEYMEAYDKENKVVLA